MSNVVVESIQYSSLMPVDDVAPISDRDHEILSDLRDVLRKHNATDRFGVSLLHRHFDIGPDEVLMESTDVNARRSLLEVVPKAGQAGRTLTTQWRFSQAGDIDADTECRTQCHYDDGHQSVHVPVAV